MFASQVRLIFSLAAGAAELMEPGRHRPARDEGVASPMAARRCQGVARGRGGYN